MRLLRGSLTPLSATSEAGRRPTGVWGLMVHPVSSQQQFLHITNAVWVATVIRGGQLIHHCVDRVTRSGGRP